MITMEIGKTYVTANDATFYCSVYYKSSKVFECLNTKTLEVVQFDETGVSLSKRYHLVAETTYTPAIVESIQQAQQAQQAQQTGTKFDSGKRAWWYMSNLTNELGEVMDVLEYGDRKYPATDGCNWKNVQDAERRYVSALMRHLTAYMSGEQRDSESGKTHLAHLTTNALFLLWFQNNRTANQS